MITHKTYDEDVITTYKKAMSRLIDENNLLSEKQKTTLNDYRDDLELGVPINYYDEEGKLNKLKPLKSYQSIDTYMRKIINMVIHIQKEFEDITKEDLKEYRRYLKNTPINSRNNRVDEQNEDMCMKNVTIEYYFTLIKTFFIWYYNKDDNKNILPDLVRNFKRGRIQREKINQAEVLTPKEIRDLINNCNKERDKCVISTLYESSARCGELLGLNISSFEDKESYGLLRLKGKTGIRKVAISDSLIYLRNWINKHPNKDDPNAPLFISNSKTHQHKRIDRSGVRFIIKRAVKAIGLKKKHNPHWFRHSHIDLLYRTANLNQYDLRIHCGWSPNSNMDEIYVHYGEEGVNDKILKSKNKQLKLSRVEDKALEPKICTRCRELFPEDPRKWEHSPTSRYCTCGQVLDKSEIMKVQRLENEEKQFMRELMKHPVLSNLNNVNELSDIFFNSIINNPSLSQRFKELIERNEIRGVK